MDYVWRLTDRDSSLIHNGTDKGRFGSNLNSVSHQQIQPEIRKSFFMPMSTVTLVVELDQLSYEMTTTC